MKYLLLPALLLASLVPSGVSAEDYRSTITISVENKSFLPNRVQVRDVEARYDLPEDCRIAKKVADGCFNARPDYKPLRRETEMTCAVALALREETRCTIKGLIFDDWIDPGRRVELPVHVGVDGYGLVGVRAVNNTDSWTYKPGLHDGDVVGHQ